MSSFLTDSPLPSPSLPPSACPLHRRLQLSSHDLPSLLFSFLNEALFLFHTEDFLITASQVAALGPVDSPPQAQPPQWRLEAEWGGEVYDRRRHGGGTEIKAITYSCMQIYERGRRLGADEEQQQQQGMHAADLFVIVDI